ncbi:MAG: hypothetical protein U0K92_06490 [Treponema sp.]|nr:hypothetical protein [Treponema sp.]
MYNEKDLELKGFDLGEQGGGMQLIIAAKTISPTEFYVATVGNSLPKIQNSPKQDLPSDEIMTDEEIKELIKKFESNKSIDELNLFKNVEQTDENKKWDDKEKNDIKIRFFKLSFIEDELNAEEYITWEGIVNVAKFMGLC